jgi:hypothetical protein
MYGYIYIYSICMFICTCVCVCVCVSGVFRYVVHCWGAQMGISQILDGLSTDMGIGVVFKQQLQGLSRNFTDSRIAPSAKIQALRRQPPMGCIW